MNKDYLGNGVERGLCALVYLYYKWGWNIYSIILCYSVFGLTQCTRDSSKGVYPQFVFHLLVKTWTIQGALMNHSL